MKDLPGESHDDKKTGNVTEGPIDCPYCKHRISDSVQYLGQSITCPKCKGLLKAPESRQNVLAVQGFFSLLTVFFVCVAVYYWITLFFL